MVSGNSGATTVINGNGDGNGCGNNNTENRDGRADGNGVTGKVLIAGGGIANSGSLFVFFSRLASNSLACTLSNGNNNGDHDGQSDGSNNNWGNNCGNGVGGDVEVDGGGLDNSGTASLLFSLVFGNSAACTITNGEGNGLSGGGEPASTGNDGHGDGNGVHDNGKVIGGGTANVGTLTLVFTTITGNSIATNPGSGGGDVSLDGVVVGGAIPQAARIPSVKRQ